MPVVTLARGFERCGNAFMGHETGAEWRSPYFVTKLAYKYFIPHQNLSSIDKPLGCAFLTFRSWI